MTLVNNEIVGKTLKVLSEDGKFLGVFPREVALKMAKTENKDLVCINENATEPLCKIIDLGKFQYQENKNKKAHKPVKIETKEIQIRPTTDLHDLQVKASQTSKFLKAGNKVKISMNLKGREINNIGVAQENFDKFVSLLNNYVVEKPKTTSENSIIMQIKGESING